MLKSRILTTLIAAFAFGAFTAQSAQAQPFPNDPVQPGPAPGAPVNTLRTPLIQGHPSAPAFIPPAEGQPPAIGDGSTPAPVIPGHSSLPVTLLPWVPVIPANQIDQGSSGIPLPVNPAVVSPPGVLGPSLTGIVPAPPSTPGFDPGSLTAPTGSFNASEEVNIIPSGGIPGSGGFNTDINTVRRGGQETHQYGYRGHNSILGGGASDGSQDNIERLGPWAGFGTVTGVPTGNGWRNSAIDLGGGQRFKTGGQVIPTGSSVQDFGLSSTRDHGIGALQAHQSTEFGQGMRRLPVFSHKTTDFGFNYHQFDPANVNPQKQDHLIVPTAVRTNF